MTMHRITATSLAAALLLAGSAFAQGPAQGRVSTQMTDIGQGLEPHRAAYDLSLARAGQRDGVRAARGNMVYTLTDRCDGYTVESVLKMNLAFSSGISNDVEQYFAGWEAKDGRSASFRMQVVENGDISDSYRGTISLNDDGTGTATYDTGGQTVNYDLPKGTMLSTAHIADVLRRAKAGEKFISRTVIDGVFDTGPYRITAVVGPERPDDRRKPEADLAQGQYLPVGLAYFPLSSKQDTPEYEIAIKMLPNGVARNMRQDFGDFVLAFELARVEPMPRQPC